MRRPYHPGPSALPLGLALVLASFACSSDREAGGTTFATLGDDGVDPTGSDETGINPTSTSSGDGDPSSGDGDPTSGDGDEDGIKFDIVDPDAFDPDMFGDDACQKVDLLFVIDNSWSMESEQASLVASFPGFVAGIQASLDSAESYHVGVVSTDTYDHNSVGCNEVGALVTKTGGSASSNMNCEPFSSGARFLDETEPDLAAKFACIAQVGTGGAADEVMAEAAYKAVSPAFDAPGECNTGFLRDDALLVVVIITDEDDQHGCVLGGNTCGSDGEPADWAQQLIQAKGGIEENVVVLTLAGGPNNGCEADDAQRLVAMTSLFTNGSVGDICAPSYEGFFNAAISVIDSACDSFTPPG